MVVVDCVKRTWVTEMEAWEVKLKFSRLNEYSQFCFAIGLELVKAPARGCCTYHGPTLISTRRTCVVANRLLQVYRLIPSRPCFEKLREATRVAAWPMSGHELPRLASVEVEFYGPMR